MYSLRAILMVVPVMLVSPGYAPAQRPDTPALSRRTDDKPADGAKIDRLIRQLGSSEFHKREAASKALAALAEAPLPALRKAQDDPDPEIRRRVGELIRVQKRRRAAMRAKAWARFRNLSCIIGSSTRTSDGVIGGIGLNENVRDEDLEWLQWIDELETLQFTGSRITDAGLVHLKKLPRLRILLLLGTEVTDVGLAHLKDLDRLFLLTFDGTKVSDAGLVHLKALKSLVRLDLSGTRITDAGLDHLKDMKRLGWLSISHTQVSDAGITKLKGLKLYYLNLSGTQITDAGLVHLKEVKDLHVLDLSKTGITDAGLAHLKAIPMLERLTVLETKMSKQAKADLKKSKPKLVFVGE